jgi:hypothetical protein
MEIRGLGAILAAQFSPVARLQLEEEEALQRAEMRLAVVTPPETAGRVQAEVQRRQSDLGMSARAARESVADDVICGRWDIY